MTVIFLSLLALWLVSLCCHEYAHARVAYSGGDHTVAAKGYLSMNPLRYMHPMMSVVIPLLILALGGIPLPGGAVYIEMARLRSKAWQSAVSAAGPLANLLLMIVAAIPFQLGLYDPDQTGLKSLWIVLATFGYLQLLCVMLNLLPLPGFDGFGIISPYLPWTWRRAAYSMGNLSFLLLIVIFMTDNPFRTWFRSTAAATTLGLGFPGPLINAGFNALEILRR